MTWCLVYNFHACLYLSGLCSSALLHSLHPYSKAFEPGVIWMLMISSTFIYYLTALLPSTLPPTCSGTHVALSPVTNPDDLSAMCSQVRSNLLYLTADNSD